jgi:hypothetical protein
MGLKIDEDGLERVARRFFSRRDVRELCSTIDDVKKVLIEHARISSDGCVNCIYSSPYRGRLSWTVRYCSLGLKKEECHMRKPIVEGEG